MSKVITSPVKRWPGSITIADPLYMSHVELIEAALNTSEQNVTEGQVFYTVLDKPALPAIFACVEKWELENFPASPTAETFPMSPRKDSHALIDFIMGEIIRVYTGEEQVPNE